MAKESDNLILYKKITEKFTLNEKNYLYLGSYLLSMEVTLKNKNNKEEEKNDIPKKNKFKQLEKMLSDKE